MKLYSVLEKLLVAKKINLTRLSQATGVPIQTIHNWLSGQNPHNLDQLKKIANYFGVSIDYLCFGGNLEIKNDRIDIRLFENEINTGTFEVVLRRPTELSERPSQENPYGK